jgi:hypothetical protein
VTSVNRSVYVLAPAQLIFNCLPNSRKLVWGVIMSGLCKTIKGFFSKKNSATPPPPGNQNLALNEDYHYYGDQYWDYTDQYAEITSEGSLKPPPRLGSPSFSWHLAIWQRYTVNANPVIPKLDSNKGIYNEFERSNAHDFAFFDEISTFLKRLQERGRVEEIEIESLRFEQPEALPDSSKDTYKFGRCQPQSLSFTLWWQDNANRDNPNKRQKAPSPDDLRVRVQAQTFQDHATVTFYIDAAKPYNRRQLFRAQEVTGVRRLKVNQYLQAIREVASAQVKSGAIEHNFIPEREVTPEQAELLRDGAEYFFESIWKEFQESFGITKAEGSEFALLQGEIFADFRGAMMYVPGIETEASDKRRHLYDSLRSRMGINVDRPPADKGASASIGIGSFETFDNKSGEPNTVVRAHWPFIRRMTPWADYRDFSASGIIDWRALFITGLGGSGNYYGREESANRDAEVPKGHRHKDEVDGEISKVAPIRWLVLTKGEPHRAQIGRFIERITAVGTMRLFALRNLATIKNAATHIRVISRELDGILADWTQQRETIDGIFHDQVEKIHESEKAKKERWSFFGRKSVAQTASRQLEDDVLEIENLQYAKAMDEKVRRLTALIYKTELKLIKLGANLDEIGQKGSGRLLYLISRAEYHIHEFERMRETLEIGNIDGWINYSQFVSRGLQPTFSLITRTGQRLLSLRTRLQVITETIQTSALIVETEATRANTQTLKNIASTLYWVKRSAVTIAILTGIVTFMTFSSRIEKALSWVKFDKVLDWIKHVIDAVLG